MGNHSTKVPLNYKLKQTKINGNGCISPKWEKVSLSPWVKFQSCFIHPLALLQLANYQKSFLEYFLYCTNFHSTLAGRKSRGLCSDLHTYSISNQISKENQAIIVYQPMVNDGENSKKIGFEVSEDQKGIFQSCQIFILIFFQLFSRKLKIYLFCLIQTKIAPIRSINSVKRRIRYI